MSFHVLLLDRAGNNLVNADFSLYLGHIFTVKHIYLTLYIEYMCRIAPIYSVHLYLLALLAVAVVPPARSVPAARRARLPAPVCASADAWSTVDFFVRRPCVACLACPLSVCVWARVLAVLACSRACLLPCLPAPVPVCSRCSRLYCSFSRRALARCSTLSARRKLFRDRFQAVDICSAVVRRDG